MRSSSDATLNLSPLLTHGPGSALEVSGEGLLTPDAELLTADGLRLAGPVAWELRVINTGGDDDFVLEGSVSAPTSAECRRCLTDVTTEVSADFVYPMVYKPSDAGLVLDELEEGGEDVLVFGAPEVDFAAFLTQMVAIEQPLTVVCTPDCLGLNEDGINLNDHPELLREQDDEEGPRRSPFAVLSDIDLGA